MEADDVEQVSAAVVGFRTPGQRNDLKRTVVGDTRCIFFCSVAEMIEETRGTLFAVGYYFAGITAAFCALFVITLATIKLTPVLPSADEREKSTIEKQLENSREIRAALSRPIPRPGPLPAITAKLANPYQPKVASRDQAKAQHKSSMSQTAREAFGMALSSVQPQPPDDYYPRIDRYRPL